MPSDITPEELRALASDLRDDYSTLPGHNYSTCCCRRCTARRGLEGAADALTQAQQALGEYHEKLGDALGREMQLKAELEQTVGLSPMLKLVMLHIDCEKDQAQVCSICEQARWILKQEQAARTERCIMVGCPTVGPHEHGGEAGQAARTEGKC